MIGKMKPYKFQVGDIYTSGEHGSQFKILEQGYRDGYGVQKVQKAYKVECCKCHKTQWLTEKYIIASIHGQHNSGCGCKYCGNVGSKYMKFENVISKTDPWMVSFFKNPEDADKYTAESHKKAWFKCPYCGRERYLTVRDVHQAEHVPCDICGDGVSIPNKFAYSVLRQVHAKNLEREYSPEWAEGKKYDFSFFANGNHYLLQMDGGFHYLDRFGETAEESQAKDRHKDNLAMQNGCIMIRVLSLESTIEYLKEEILKSRIAEIFDLSVVDWELVRKDCANSTMYRACIAYEEAKSDPTMSLVKLGKQLGISDEGLRNYLQRADAIGLITYEAFHPKKPERYNNFVKYKIEHPWLGNKELSSVLEIPVTTIQSYTERAVKENRLEFKTPMEYKMSKLVKKYIEQKDNISKTKFCQANNTTQTTLNKYLRKAGLYESKK